MALGRILHVRDWQNDARSVHDEPLEGTVPYARLDGAGGRGPSFEAVCIACDEVTAGEERKTIGCFYNLPRPCAVCGTIVARDTVRMVSNAQADAARVAWSRRPINLAAFREVMKSECRCKGGIPYSPCRHEIASVLLKLVDAQARPMLAVEWVVGEFGLVHCAVCRAIPTSDDGRHYSHCFLDDALSLAGFADRASRDAERARLGIETGR